MAANVSPIYTRVGDIQWVSLTAANTAYDGTGTVGTIFTADATNGGFVSRIRLKPLGTNVASVARIFINNGSTNTTAANNVLYEEFGLPATTAIQTASLLTVEAPVNLILPPGYKLNFTLGTAVSAGWIACAIGGKY